MVIRTDMTRNQAQRLMEDIEKSLTTEDFSEDIYLSIKDVGTKTFKKCAYHEVDGYTFIWTETERYLISKQEIGEYVIIPYDPNFKISLKKVT